MRVVAIVAAYNEERFIGACLEHLISQDVEVYLIDNSSTDRTVEIAERYVGSGLIDIESFPRAEGVYKWRSILERKEELAASLEADWFMHADPDEIRLPSRSDRTLAQAFEEVDEKGYNAVNFLEFTFVPTREAPDHDHPHFQQTMRWYYPFQRHPLSQVKAWKRQRERVELARSGGHRVRFPGICLYPESFTMRHYLFLSVPHLLRKYVGSKYDAAEVQGGWHSWRVRIAAEKIELPSQDALNTYTSDAELDLSNPRLQHITENWALPQEGEETSTGSRDSMPSRQPARQAAPGSRSADLGPGTARNEVPIIVGGYFRSGNSLIRRTLDAHSRIHCGPQVGFFRDFHGDYLGDPLRHARFTASARRMLPKVELFKILGGTFITLHEKAAARAGKPRWADNNPENLLYLSDWRKLLGDEWVFVHVVRDPLDTLASIKKAESPHVIPPTLDARIDLYKRYTQAGVDFGELHPERYYRVVYERFVDQPESQMSSLMDWLGEDFEPVQVNFDQLADQKGSGDSKRNTIEMRAARIGFWRELLTPSEAEKISHECGLLWQQISGGLDYGSQPQNEGLPPRP